MTNENENTGEASTLNVTAGYDPDCEKCGGEGIIEPESGCPILDKPFACDCNIIGPEEWFFNHNSKISGCEPTDNDKH